MGFFALLAAYLYMRLEAGMWPPANEPEPPLMLTGISTIFAVLSSVFYQWGLHDVSKKAGKRLVPALGIATLTALVFIGIQLAAGVQGVARGLRWDSGIYASFLWLTAGFHYAHVLVGIGAGAYLTQNARLGVYNRENYLTVQLWGYFWHSICVVWILIYCLVFLTS